MRSKIFIKYNCLTTKMQQFFSIYLNGIRSWSRIFEAVYSPEEISGLWNFSVPVLIQKPEPDPVLNRKFFENILSDPFLFPHCNTMYFLGSVYFVSWGKTTDGVILPLAKYSCASEVAPECRSQLRHDSAFFFRSRIRTRSQNFGNYRTRSGFTSISAVAGVCVEIS